MKGRPQTTDFRLQTTDHRLQTSDFRQTRDYRPQTPALHHSSTPPLHHSTTPPIRTAHPSVLLLLSALLFAPYAHAAERFPPPDFESGYSLPETTTPPPRIANMAVVDVVVLLFTLGLASYLALKRRRRNEILYLSMFSLVYFGFYREGCVCAIGSIQNVSLAMFDGRAVIPLGVLAFFILPLAFTLFFGRTFCAAACPHGALQDLVLVKPVKVPAWLEQGLRLVPYVYLGGAVLLAATGSAFIICQFDPFIGLFRMTGTRNMLLFGGGFLIAGMFIGRPYCRYLCPYGAILGLLSKVSKWHVAITPDECIQCRLCEESCPFAAIHHPTPSESGEARPVGRARLGRLLLLLPVCVILGGWLGARLSGPISLLHPQIDLAEQVFLAETGQLKETDDAVKAFRQTGRPSQELFDEALPMKERYVTWGWFFGAFVGLV
ncbi:MAG: 4Fe-4S binding protein, partial [Planctomycetota bacterium]|nr:4Fe-4S binding protein [Planctomycetota bacterium]